MDKPGYIVYLLRHCKCCVKHTGLLHWNDYTIYDIFLFANSQYVWSKLNCYLFPNSYCQHLLAWLLPYLVLDILLSTDIIPFWLLNEVLSEVTVSHKQVSVMYYKWRVPSCYIHIVVHKGYCLDPSNIGAFILIVFLSLNLGMEVCFLIMLP